MKLAFSVCFLLVIGSALSDSTIFHFNDLAPTPCSSNKLYSDIIAQYLEFTASPVISNSQYSESVLYYQENNLPLSADVKYYYNGELLANGLENVAFQFVKRNALYTSTTLETENFFVNGNKVIQLVKVKVQKKDEKGKLLPTQAVLETSQQFLFDGNVIKEIREVQDTSQFAFMGIFLL